METFSDILALWPDRDAVAEDCQTSYGVVKQWDRRGSIPAPYWHRLVEGAQRRSIPGITYERLADIASRALPQRAAS